MSFSSASEMDEDTTHVLPGDSRGMEKGIAVVDGMVIVHKMKPTSSGTVDLTHSFNELLLSVVGCMMRSSLSLTRTRTYL